MDILDLKQEWSINSVEGFNMGRIPTMEEIAWKK